MEENLRLSYLAAMEIPVWVRRGADDRVLPAIDVQPAIERLPPTVVPAERPSAREILGHTRKSPAAVTEAPRPPVEAERQPTKMREQIAQYTFASAGRLLCIDEDISSQQRSGCSDLLGAMAFAVLGSRVEIDMQVFEWPPSGGVADQSQPGDALLGRMGKLLESGEYAHVILMGAGLAAKLLGWGAQEFSGRNGEAQQIAGLGCPVLVTRSCTEMLADPLLKREVWRDLQPARR